MRLSLAAQTDLIQDSEDTKDGGQARQPKGEGVVQASPERFWLQVADVGRVGRRGQTQQAGEVRHRLADAFHGEGGGQLTDGQVGVLLDADAEGSAQQVHVRPVGEGGAV